MVHSSSLSHLHDSNTIIGGSCHKYNFCRDKHNFAATEDVFCRDKSMLVAAKMILVAAPVNDTTQVLLSK